MADIGVVLRAIADQHIIAAQSCKARAVVMEDSQTLFPASVAMQQTAEVLTNIAVGLYEFARVVGPQS